MKPENDDEGSASLTSLPTSLRGLVGPALAAIPHIGGPLSALWSQWDTDRRFARVEETLAEIRRLLQDPAYRFDVKRLAEEDMQLLEVVLQEVQYQHAEHKRTQFAKLLASCWTEAQAFPFDERLLFVRALGEFNDVHLNILSALGEPENHGALSYEVLREKAGRELESEIEQDSLLLPAIDRLASGYGFVSRRFICTPDPNVLQLAGGGRSPEDTAKKCEHTITPLGRRFLTSLSAPTSKD